MSSDTLYSRGVQICKHSALSKMFENLIPQEIYESIKSTVDFEPLVNFEYREYNKIQDDQFLKMYQDLVFLGDFHTLKDVLILAKYRRVFDQEEITGLLKFIYDRLVRLDTLEKTSVACNSIRFVRFGKLNKQQLLECIEICFQYDYPVLFKSFLRDIAFDNISQLLLKYKPTKCFEVVREDLGEHFSNILDLTVKYGDERLAEYLIEERVISPSLIHSILEARNTKLLRYALDSGIVPTIDDLDAAMDVHGKHNNPNLSILIKTGLFTDQQILSRSLGYKLDDISLKYLELVTPNLNMLETALSYSDINVIRKIIEKGVVPDERCLIRSLLRENVEIPLVICEHIKEILRMPNYKKHSSITKMCH